MDAIKKFLIKYKICASYEIRDAEREYTIFSCNKQQAIHDAIQALTYFNNSKPIEILNCIEIK